MRITEIIVSPAFAGTERYTVEVGTELARRGHDVEVIGGAPDTMQALVTTPVRWRAGASAPQALQSLIRGGRRDIVHSHITKADFAAAAAAPLTGGVRVATRHITARRGYTDAAASVGRLVRRGMRREIAVSAYVAAEVGPAVTDVLVNGVVPGPDRTGDRERVVLVAQRLAAEKRTDLALEAWRATDLGPRGWRLVIAGDGPERPELERLAVDLTGVSVLGWVEDLAPLLAGSAILLATAPHEPCGLTVLEAMAQGTAVVAAGSGGHLETVGREPTAALFPPGDSAAAAAALARLAADEPSRDHYGAALQSLQRREFSLAGHVDGLDEVYALALGGRRTATPAAVGVADRW